MKLFNKIAVASIGLAMAMGVGVTAVSNETVKTSAAGTEVTINFTTQPTVVNGTITYSSSHLTILQEKGSSSSAVSNYYNPARWYAKHKVTFTPKSGFKVTKMVFTANSSSYATALKNSTWTGFGTVPTISGSTVTWQGEITDPANIVLGAQSRINKIVYTYEEAGSQVNVPVEGVSLDKTNATLYPGSQVSLSHVFTPVAPTNKNVTWTTSNSSVATVNGGLVTAVAAGSAVITVTTEDGGFTATCNVTVNSFVDDNYDYTDILNSSVTGVTGSSYASWSGKSAKNAEKSTAIYNGYCAGGNDSIQIRTDYDPTADKPKLASGVTVTSSDLLVKKIVAVFDSNTAATRKLDIYASNEPIVLDDLYSSPINVTKVGSISAEAGFGEYVFTKDYSYFAVRSNSSAMYVDALVVSWDKAFTAEDEAAALAFAEDFSHDLAGICADENADNSAALTAVWEDWKAQFEALSSGAKIVFNTSDDQYIAGARSLYAHIVGRYGLATWEGATPVASAAPFGAIMNNNANIMLIAVIALVSIAGVALILKKKASAK